MRIIVGKQFDPDDLDRALTLAAREAMLGLILRWASLEGSVSQLFAAAFNLTDERYADRITDDKMSVKLRELQKEFRSSAPELAATLGKLKKQADKYAKVRDTIAHCHCAGMSKSEPDRLIFLRYRSHPHGKGLIVDAMPLETFQEATRFAEHLRGVVDRLADALRTDQLTKPTLG